MIRSLAFASTLFFATSCADEATILDRSTGDDATSAVATQESADPAVRRALERIRDRALEAQPRAGYGVLTESVGLCHRDPRDLPRALARAIQTANVVPFVGPLEPPFADQPTSGYVYDAATRTVFVDADLVATLTASGDPRTPGALAMAMGLVFADATATEVGADFSIEARFAAAGAFTRVFFAGPSAPAALERAVAGGHLAHLRGTLATVAARQSTTPMALVSPAGEARALDAYARGYRAPALDFVDAHRSGR